MKKLVIFDLDGTLLNTIEDLGHAANYALEKNGFQTHSMASYPFFVGNGVRRLLERAIPEEFRNTVIFETALRDLKDYYDVHNTDCTKPYGGIVELLATLRSRGVQLAVVSNKYQSAVEHIVGHFFPDIEFVAVVGQTEGMNVKPDPSCVFKALVAAGVGKREAVMVGDSGIDMETARRACVDSIGVTWGFRPVKELVESYANVIVNSPSEILDHLDSDYCAPIL
ncbi:MAG: HAD family hydrolase [Bacteroidales bacterium]|nr:HAD family hydrolase [Candidatus Sodaliphilus aphodohippi]